MEKFPVCLFTLALSIFIAGCASQSPIRVDRLDGRYHVTCSKASNLSAEEQREEIRHALQEHIVSIDKKGLYRPIRYTLNCAGESEHGEQPASLRKLFRKISKTVSEGGYTEIMVVLHGGLVSRETGVREAVILHHAIETDPWLQTVDNKVYPIFINWRSGGLESYWEQLVNIRGGEEKPLLGRATAPFKLASDLGSGIADTLYTAGLEGERLIDSLGNHLNACQAQAAEPRIVCPDPVTKNKLETIPALQYFLMMPVRVGTAPIINGFGRSAWENMVRQTRFLFLSENFGEETRGAIDTLFEELGKSIKNSEDGSVKEIPPVRLSLVGHSMGSMVISEIVEAFPDLPYRNIVFLGAAVSGRDFRNTIIPLLESSNYPDLHFYNISLLPSNEARELNFAGTLPSGSLLEWIDELYTSPPTFADRTFGKWINASRFISTYPKSALEKMTFRIFGRDPGQPRTHGELNDIETCFWRKTYWTDEEMDWPEHAVKCKAFIDDSSVLGTGSSSIR